MVDEYTFTCRECDAITFGLPADRDKHGKPICEKCFEGNNK